MAQEEDAQTPFSRPGFIAATAVVALIVVLGIVLVIVNATRNDDPPTAAPANPAATSTTTQAPDTVVTDGASVCGLEGEEVSGTVTSAPDAQWEYQGTIAYPTSMTYGPAEATADGLRYCFQHSPTGALFMAANAAAQGSDPVTSAEWATRALADGPYRDHLIGEIGGGSSTEGTRLTVAGFRILNYDGATARVDLGVKVSSDGQNVTMSAVYELVWQEGDWKVSSDVQSPLDAASIPDLAGYIPWGE